MTQRTPTNAPEKSLSRRQIIQASAWAVPVVALAVATPLAAASPPPPEQYTLAGISCTGEPGETLTGLERPGARIRTVGSGSPVAGQVVVFVFISGPFTLDAATAVTDAEGAARVGVTFAADAPRGVLGAIQATWRGADGVDYEDTVDVSTTFAAPPA